jgi:hypothetical protein
MTLHPESVLSPKSLAKVIQNARYHVNFGMTTSRMLKYGNHQKRTAKEQNDCASLVWTLAYVIHVQTSASLHWVQYLVRMGK